MSKGEVDRLGGWIVSWRGGKDWGRVLTPICLSLRFQELSDMEKVTLFPLVIEAYVIPLFFPL